MKSKLLWTDFLDEKRMNLFGEFSLYRNYRDIHGNFLMYYYQRPRAGFVDATQVQDNKEEPTWLWETTPIAIGITAFFVCDYNLSGCLKFFLKKDWDFKANDLYLKYFNNCIGQEYKKNDKLPNPDFHENVKKQFISNHLKEERIKLEESKKYFEECKDADDEKINNDIKEFVNGYFIWLTGTVTNEPNFTLEKACRGPEQYESIKAWFIKANLCDPDTFVWKDRKSGNRKVLAGYLKDLEIRGYTEHLADIEILNIVKNSFHIKIEISTIQHAKANIESKIPHFLTE